MKNLLKKLTLLGALMVAALALPAGAGAVDANFGVQPSAKDFTLPLDTAGKQVDKLDFVGVAVSTKDITGTQSDNSGGLWTSSRVYLDGPGLLYGVEVASGAAVTDFIACTDEAAVNEIGSAVALETDVVWLTIINRSATVAQNIEFRWPRYFKNGLTCDSSSAFPYIPLFRSLK